MNSVTLRVPTSSQKRLKLPRSSGIVTANTASRASPTSARSATKRMRSKFMFAPEVTATSVWPVMPSRSAYCFAPATASAPAGSSTLRVSWKTSLMAAHSASVSTVSTSSRYCWHSRKVSSPTSLTAVPSENRPTSLNSTRLPAFTDCAIAHESSVCTPITRISGRTAFT
ncbi:hypothetical protein LMG28688_07270 [Paraburkholderia caffeinitolerans]|uniref:Uncharacterized protein n=1 Tax=Paraburkholderia caffeinitolerans TaxID=1723730 RepID=A0A6J5H4T3_9BURK|nr:hypothetical protein LMG28688_07270 [Paraburkholderia caffeinitolerans]